MPDQPAPSETFARRLAMLQTAFEGPVRTALEAPDTIEILANTDGTIRVETASTGLVASPIRLSVSERERIIRLVASSTGAVCDHASPIISAELPGSGERFEGVMPPVSEAPCFAIRKSAATPFTLDHFIEIGAMSQRMGFAIRDAINCRQNIIVAGGTSSGKTTLANALLSEPAFSRERIVTLEDTRELYPKASDKVQLRTQGALVTLRDLVRSTLRLRPDRIVVGEVRGAEALDLLKAWNTGHPGGITTLHANSCHGALSRLEQLVGEAGHIDASPLISEAVDVILFMSRSSGQRRIEDAIRVCGLDGSGYRTEPFPGPL